MSQKEVIYRASEAQVHAKFRAFNASTRAVGSDMVEVDISTLEPQAVLRQLRGMLPLGVEILVWPHVVYDAVPGSPPFSSAGARVSVSWCLAIAIGVLFLFNK